MTLERLLPGNIFDIQPAYHKGRWVYVPMFYIPAGAVGDDGCLHQFQFLPLDGQELPKPSPRRCCDLAYERMVIEIKETILPWALSKNEIKELCTNNNNIPLAWVTDQYPKNIPNNYVSTRSSRRKIRKYSSLSASEFRCFIKQLRGISVQSAVVAEILWFLNRSLQPGNDYITLEEVLRMHVQDVDPEDGLTTCIRLFRKGPRGCHMVVHYLQKAIWKVLCQQISEDSLFAFSNKKGGYMLPSDIARHFRKAGKLAGLKESVCSLSLRPISKESYSAKQIGGNPFENARLHEVSIQEWEMLCRQIPNLIGKRGRPSKHDPRCIINALLYHFRTGAPFRKLPEIYPPAKAIHSQYRRWLKNGVFDAVLEARQ